MTTNDEVRTSLWTLRTVLEREGAALARVRDDALLDVVVEIEECTLAVRRALLALESEARDHAA